jgi:glycosyltransferase involved in cell wall biosynthesis
VDDAEKKSAPVRVSVIIPTLNPGPETLRTLIAALRAQQGVEVEVIVVDSSSTDGSAESCTWQTSR